MESVIGAGDHTVLIGGVLAGQVTEEPASPLMYWRRNYGSWHAAGRPSLAGSSPARLDCGRTTCAQLAYERAGTGREDRALGNRIAAP